MGLWSLVPGLCGDLQTRVYVRKQFGINVNFWSIQVVTIKPFDNNMKAGLSSVLPQKLELI